MNTSELQSLLSNRANLSNALLDIEKVREQELGRVNTKFDQKVHRLNRHAEKGNGIVLEEVKKRYLNVNHGKALKGYLHDPFFASVFNYRVGLKSNSFNRVLETNADFLPDVRLTVGRNDYYNSALLSELYSSENFLITQIVTTKRPWERAFGDIKFFASKVFLIVDIKGNIIGAFPDQEFFKGGLRFNGDRQYSVNIVRNPTTLRLSLQYNGNILDIDDNHDNMMLKPLLPLIKIYDDTLEAEWSSNSNRSVLFREKAIDELWEDQECT